MGITQKESQFELAAKMNFSPKKNLEEAGITVYQKDLNYINLTVQIIGKQHHLKLSVSEKSDRQKTNLSNSETIAGSNVKAYKSKALPNYKGEILLKIASKNGKYLYYYSLDGGASYEKLA